MPICPTETLVLRPGAGAAASSGVAAKISTFFLTKQWIGARTASSPGPARSRVWKVDCKDGVFVSIVDWTSVVLAVGGNVGVGARI